MLVIWSSENHENSLQTFYFVHHKAELFTLIRVRRAKARHIPLEIKGKALFLCHMNQIIYLFWVLTVKIATKKEFILSEVDHLLFIVIAKNIKMEKNSPIWWTIWHKNCWNFRHFKLKRWEKDLQNFPPNPDDLIQGHHLG